MTNLKGLKFNIELTSVSSVSVISRSTTSYSASCNNAGTESRNVSCPINQAHRNINTVYEVASPYSDLALSGYSTEIDLIKNQNYTVLKSILSGPPNDATVAVNIDAEWLLTNNTLNSYTLASEKIPNYNSIMFPLGPDTCVSMSITDTIYQLKFTFNTNVVLTPTNSDDNAYQALDNITTRSITGSSTSASYTSTLDVKVNYIWLNITSMGIIPCGGSAPTPAPVPGVNNAMSRYGVVTDPITKQNSLGLYYGFTASQVGSVFNYGDIDKYKLLIKRDDCFKILIVFILPVFPIFIPIPTWINVEIVNKVTQAITQAVTTAQGTFNQALTIALEVKDQINVKNAAVLATRGAAIAKVVASGQANDILAQAAKNALMKQLNVLQTSKNYAEFAQSLANVQYIIDKTQTILNTLSAIESLVNMFTDQSGSENSLKTLAETGQTISKIVNTAIQDFIDLVDKAPDSPVKQRIQKTIKDIKTYINMMNSNIKTLIQVIIAKIKQTRDPITILEPLLKGLIEVFFDIKAIRQLFVIIKDFDLTQLAYDLILEQVDQLGVIKTAAELDERASQQQKSQLEQQANALAQEAASAIDDTIGQVAEVLHLKDLENLALQGIKEADKLLTAATDALNSAVDDIGAAKRQNINTLIGTYLVQNLDLYKISTFGSFDENNPLDRQIVINDIKGTRIYDINGNLLFEKADFCNQPFMEIAGSLNSNGCRTTDNDPIIDTSPCGSYTCKNFGYWYGIGRFKTSFDFYQNHDLSKGGIRVGDFDGDGIDDLWCHYPGSTKNYDKFNANEIIYAPLKSYNTNNRFTYKQKVLTSNSWCKDGVIKIGDFNGDKKDDAFCISDTAAYLLYSNGESFRSASSNEDGSINITGVTNSREFVSQNANGWSKSSNIVVGDFDGDGCKDLLKITSNNMEILYGQRQGSFVTKPTVTATWASNYQQQLSICNQVGVNKIIIGDLNNDGSDDIACITGDTITTINSPLSSSENIQETTAINKVARLSIIDINLYPIDSTSAIQRKTRLSYKTHKNLFAANGLLISTNDMLPQHKTVSSINMPLQCLNQSQYEVITYITFSKTLTIPEKLLWENADSRNQLVINIDATSKMVGSDVIELFSNPVQSFAYKLQSYQGSCYEAQAVTNLIALVVHYNATMQMTIEQNGNLLVGPDLILAAKKILPNYDVLDEATLSFPVSGDMIINILGTGYDILYNCN